MDTIVVARTGMTLDLLLYRRFGVEGQRLVEEVLESNPGLAELGALLPIGTPVRVPATLPEQAAFSPRAVVDLFA